MMTEQEYLESEFRDMLRRRCQQRRSASPAAPAVAPRRLAGLRLIELGIEGGGAPWLWATILAIGVGVGLMLGLILAPYIVCEP
jgi:hypothetical protein